MLRRWRCAFPLVAVALATTAVSAEHSVPFKGTWTGETISADPFTTFPVVQIVAAGGGEFTHLGKSTMVSPHTTNIFTGLTEGDQIFTAANGDTLTAFCSGVPVFDPVSGVVQGTLACEVTGGTGRFADATGSYTFSLVGNAILLPDGGLGFATVATIDGAISY